MQESRIKDYLEMHHPVCVKADYIQCSGTAVNRPKLVQHHNPAFPTPKKSAYPEIPH